MNLSDGCGELTVRRARPEDRAAREHLVRDSFTQYDWDAFLLFFFQEAVLQALVLSGAVLFIFCGVSACALPALVPAAAALVWVAVLVTHRAAAERCVSEQRSELAGWVAVRGGRVVGSASISRHREPGAGWLHALAVAREVRRAGAGRALEAAARRWAAGAGLWALEADASQLQGAARELLHAAHWRCRGVRSRPLAAGLVQLLVARLAADLHTA